ncbi:MAG TPA: glycosyltransferase family 4 protein [Candidatus Paceibacterota bacterium]
MARKLLSIGTDRLLFKEGSAVRERFKEYAKKWDEIHVVVATSGRGYTETSIAPNVWIYPTRSKLKALYPLDAARLGRFIIPRRGITNITCQDPFLTAVAGTRLQREFKLPLELQLHTDIGAPNYPYTVGNKIRKSLALSYLPKADHIRVVAQRIKTYLTDKLGISAEKIEVRPIAVDVSHIKSSPIDPAANLHTKYPQFKKIALVASRLEPEKNVALAIDAMHALVQKHPEIGLVICGTGGLTEQLQQRAIRGPAAAHIVFEPWARPSTLYSYYKTADVFLVTSLFEGYGMTLVEAAAAGTKIVSTDVGIAAEMGAVIAPWNTTGYARAIEQVLALS